MPIKLTRRQAQVMTLKSAGVANPEIAVRLGIALSTVTSHLSTAYGKLGISPYKDRQHARTEGAYEEER